jgi:hypothetical protein
MDRVEVLPHGRSSVRARCRCCDRSTVIALPATAGRLSEEISHFERMHSLCNGVPR